MTRRNASEWSEQIRVSGPVHDVRLTPDLWVNGQRPRIVTGGRDTVLAVLRCPSCEIVGQVWWHQPPAGDGVMFAEVQVVTDWEPRPPRARTARVEVVPGGTVPADCPAHGRVHFGADDVFTATRRSVARAQRGKAMVEVDGRCTGARAPLPHPVASTEEKATRWLTRHAGHAEDDH